jgi:hypothetical protein
MMGAWNDEYPIVIEYTMKPMQQPVSAVLNKYLESSEKRKSC